MFRHLATPTINFLTTESEVSEEIKVKLVLITKGCEIFSVLYV